MKFVFLSLHSGVSFRGVETYVHELGNELVKKGHDVEVVQGGAEIAGALYRTTKVTGPLFSLKSIVALTKDIDVLIPTNGRAQVLLARIWSWIFKKKMLVSGHSGPGIDERWNLYCFPDLFVATSSFLGEWAKKVNPLVKTVLITDGVNIDKFNQENKSLKINLPRPIILCVAALVPMKRQELAIQAVAKLQKGSLLLVGKGPRQVYLSDLAAKLLPNRHKIIALPLQDMPQLYSSVDLFTYPTVPWEASGLVLYEAMASGLAVVANDDPIRREIVGEAGLFVDPTNINDYTKVLESAIEKKWGTKPRQQAVNRSWANIAKQYEAAIMNL